MGGFNPFNPVQVFNGLKNAQSIGQLGQAVYQSQNMSAQNRSLLYISTACQIGMNGLIDTSDPLLVPFLLAYQYAMSQRIAQACNSAAPSILQGYQTEATYFQAFLAAQRALINNAGQGNLFGTAITDAEAGNTSGVVAATEQALGVSPTQNGNITVTQHSTVASDIWSSYTMTLSSSLAPITLTTDNIDGTSTVTIFNSTGSVTNDYSGADGKGSVTGSEISVDNADGSQTTRFYSGPNGTGSVTKIDQENANGTSVITTYNPDGTSTTTTYSSPNGTGTITKTDIEGTTSSVIASTNPGILKYTYTGPIFASLVAPPNFTGTNPLQGHRITANIIVNAGAGPITNFEALKVQSLSITDGITTYSGPGVAGFGGSITLNSKYQVEGWGLSATNGSYPNPGSSALQTQGSLPNGGTFSNGAVPLATDDGGVIQASGASFGGETDRGQGTWSSSIPVATVSISPLAGKTQSLSDVLNNPQLAAQGALQNITVNGPGTFAVTGTVAVSTATGQGTFTDNGTISLSALGTNVLNLSAMNLIGSGVIVQQGESDAIYVSSASGVDFQITSGALHLANPTGFNGVVGPTSASAPSMGIFGEVDISNAQAVTHGGFDTSTGMLSLLNSAGSDVGDIHFGGVATGLRLTQEPARGSSSAYLAVNDQGTGGNIPVTFHA